MKRVTVGIPTRKRPDYLVACLTGLFLQDFQEWDLIIVAEGGRACLGAAGKALLRRFRLDKHGVVVRKAHPGGPPFNHNVVLREAKTDWILRLDDDIIIEPDFLKELVKHTRRPDLGAVGGVFPFADRAKVYLPKNWADIPEFRGKIDRPWPDFQQCLHGADPAVKEREYLYSSFLYRKDLAEKVGGFPTHYSPLAFGEETEFSHRLYKLGKKLLVEARAVGWHFAAPTGGVRDQATEVNKASDTAILQKSVSALNGREIRW